MNNNEIKNEAAKLLKAFDAGELAGYCDERTAEALADFWIEFQFARVDIECDWNDAKCERMCSRMTAELKKLGLK